MKLYRVSRTGHKAQWAPSQAEASSVKAKHMADGAKRNDLAVEAVDVPTDKAGLLGWLNKREAAPTPA